MTGETRLPSKVIPGAQNAGANGARASTVLHNFAYAYFQNAQYGPHDLLACVNSGGDSATILVYDLNSVQLVQTLTNSLGPSCDVTCLQWLPPSTSFMQHGVFLLSGNERGELVYWDVTAGIPLQRLVIPCGQPVQLLHLLSDERVLVVTNTATTYVFHTHLVDPTPLVARASDLPLRSLPSSALPPSAPSPTSAVATLASVSRKAFESSFKMPFSGLGGGGSTTSPTTLGHAVSGSSAFAFEGQQSNGGENYTVPFFPPQHWATSKLASIPVCAVTLGDRVRLIMAFDENPNDARPGVPTGALAGLDGTGGKPVARDVVYDSDDGEPTVMDVFFSEAQEEVLFFATRNSVGTYDWRLGTILNEQLVWMEDGGVEFRRIFPSAPSSSPVDRPRINLDGVEPTIPLLYSFGSDQRLVAWYLIRTDKFVTVAVDVRGARIHSKSVAQVVQSPSQPTRFAVVFEDSTVADWRYCLLTRRWKQQGVCSFALGRPTCVCRVAPHSACYALESGHMVLVDLLHGQTLRKFSVVYSGGTKMIVACQDRWEDRVWIVTHRMEDSRHHHQVSLLDTRSGEVVCVLRRPNDKADLARVKEATMDPDQQYLLLCFWNGTFEVWNTSDARLLHIYAGLGVASVTWAPTSMRRCLTGLQGQPQILAVLFSDGTLSLWSVYKDRVVVSRDSVPLFSSSAVSGGASRGWAVGDRLVFFDSHGGGLSLQFDGKLVAKRLKELPVQGSGAAVCVDSIIAGDGAGYTESAYHDAPEAASWVPGASGSSSLAGSRTTPKQSGEAAVLRSPLLDSSGLARSSPSRTRGDNSASEPPAQSLSGPTFAVAAAAPLLVSVVFEDHSFGVWEAASGDCLAYSRFTAAARRLEATQAFWLGESLVVVGMDGTTYMMDPTLTRLNSSVRSRALRRPMQTMAFLLPSQRTSLQVSLLLLNESEAGDASTQRDSNRGNRLAEVSEGDAEEDRTPASALITSVSASRRPCRGPLGQIIDESVTTLAQELQLYRCSMVPPRLARFLATTAPYEDLPTRALLVSEVFGQVDRQRFWLEATRLAAQDRPGTTATAARPEPALGPSLTPYPLADVLSPSLASAVVSRGNLQKLCEQRALALTRHRDRNIDDSRARLVVARRLLQLGEPAKAVDILLESTYESPSFNELATLSVAIAGSGSAPSSPASAALLSKTAHHAAALLLAQGDVDGAVEKYVLAGDFAEACTAYQARGLWSSAALLSKWAPSSSASPSTALLHEALTRWARHCQQQRRVLPAARLLLSLGETEATLAALHGHTPSADVAGLFALWLAQDMVARGQAGGSQSQSLARPPQTVPEHDEALRTAALNALIDFAGVLNSVGNEACEEEVLRQITQLKAAAAPFEL